MDKNREPEQREPTDEDYRWATQGYDKNRELHELLGLCWHEPLIKRAGDGVIGDAEKCICGKLHFLSAYKKLNPDYAADPRLVLRGMDKLPADKRKLFYAKLIYSGDNVEPIDDDGLIPRHYMTDTAGNLQQAAIDFLKGEL